jgi:mono/diheme cytochrome c family protein
LTLIVGLTLGPAVLAYGAGTGTATPTWQGPAAAQAAKSAKGLTHTQKLRKALAACKKETSKARRKSCETQAKRLYGAKHSKKAPKPGEPIAGTPETQPKGTKKGGGTTGAGTTAGGPATGAKEAEELQKAANVGAPTPAGVEAGKKRFAEDCAGCHGTAGTGGDGGPNLNEMPRAHSVTGVIEQLIQPIGPMPSFDSALTFQQKEQLADFVTVEITHAAEA